MKHRKINIYHMGDFVKTVKNCRAAQRETGVHSSHVPLYCKGKLIKSRKGFTFKYADEVTEETNTQPVSV